MFDHCLYFNTTTLARLVEKQWAVAFKPLGLTPPQGFMLRLILAQPGTAQYALAAELTIARPTATRLLDGLQALGLIERRGSGLDGRHWAVFPTAQALAMQAAITQASGAVTLRIQQQTGKEIFDETVAKIRLTATALKEGSL